MKAESRQNIKKLTVLIVPDQQKRIINYKSHQPISDKDEIIQVVISEKTKQQRFYQNAYDWLRMGEIAEQACSNNRQYSLEVWHKYWNKI